MRLKKDIIVTGLDIGSSKTTAVSARIGSGGTFEVLGVAAQPSKGVSRGMLVDLGEATDVVSKTLRKLREKTGRKPEKLYVNISGQTVKASRSVGMIPLALRGREVVRPDMDRCVTAASTIHLPFDREIIHRIVHNFSVDDQPWIKNPLGLYASRLSCEVYILTADVNHIQSIYKCVNDAGYDVREIVFTGLADGAILLDKSQKEEGAALIDIGDSLTEISIFSGGVLSGIDIIAFEPGNLKDDFKMSAEFNEVISRVAHKLQDFVKNGGKVASITLTGGMVFADGIIEFLEEKLPYKIKMGAIKDVGGNASSVENLRSATAIGLARCAYEKHLEHIEEGKTIVHRISNKVIDIFNNYF